MIELIMIFLIVGSLTIGGGLVAIPLIEKEVVLRGIITVKEFILMIGVAESTPGPIGINIATFVGFSQYGILGGIATTLAFILPSFILLSLIYSLLKKYRHTSLMNHWLMYLKAVVTGLILYTVIRLFQTSILASDIVFDYKAISIFVIVYFLSLKYRSKPWLLVLTGALLGMVIYSI